MLLPIKWVKDYVEIDLEIKTLSDGLNLSGSHIESILEVDKGIKNVVVGEILKIEPHPDADKLVICQVNVGEEELQIVTAAKNVFVGAVVPVALVGAVLDEGFKIKKGKLRGVESFGMFCSLAEFGFNDSVIPTDVRDGIYIIKEEAKLGQDIREVLNINDYVLEIEITPNRPDCLSILGMAREIAATFDKKLTLPEIKINNEVDKIEDYLTSIKIESANCNRYYTRVIKDVEVKNSPIWLQARLMEAGIRPINNIVDISNYVMLEYGQPLHAFDLDKIENKEIIVRQAKLDEKITTLDDKERELDENDLIIADSNNPIAIAGVMGGLDTEVTENTKVVLLESANFNGKSIRLTSNKFALRSEASSRYEKDVDAKICKDAADRFCQLVEEVGAGTVIAGSKDIYENPAEETVIELRSEIVNRKLGVNLSKEEIIKYLVGLGLKVEEDKELLVTVPTIRQDLKIEVDLIEEIGRLYGFHNIKPQPLVGELTRGEKPKFRVIEDMSKEILVGLGLDEILTYSFISPKSYDLINAPEDSELRNYATLLNPLGQDYSVMRTTLISNVLEAISRNYNRKVEDVFFYEFGNIFKPTELPVINPPKEKRTLILGGYGNNLDFYKLKEVITILLNRIGIKNIEIERETNNTTFHPGRTAKLSIDGEYIGVLGEIHPDVASNYNLKTRVYVAEIDYDIIIDNISLVRTYKELPKYPAMSRDLALVVDEEIMVGEIEAVIRKHGKKLLEDIKLFDVYTGDQIPDGKKSVAYSIRYRASDRTLTDEEVNKIQDKLIEDLKTILNAELRS